MTSAAANKEIVRTYIRALDRKNLDAVKQLFGPEFRFHLNGKTLDLKGFEETLGGFFKAFPDLDHRIEQVVAYDDRVSVRMHAYGTHLGEFNGLAATKRTFSMPLQANYRVKGGLIHEAWVSPDMAGLINQLTGDDVRERNIKLVRNLVEGYSKDLTVDQYLAPDYVHHDDGLPNRHSRGVAAHKEQIVPFQKAFPNFKVKIEDIFGDGDRVVARWSFEGKHEGDLMEIKPTNKTVNVHAITSYRVAGDRIAEAWVNFDFAGLMEQLGVTNK